MRNAGNTSDRSGGLPIMFLWKKDVVLASVLLMLLYMSTKSAEDSFLQQGIASEVLRFHVLANSDDEIDQKVKYCVRDAVLEWINKKTEQEIIATDKLANYNAVKICSGESEIKEKSEMMYWIQGHLKEIEQISDQILREQRIEYQADAELVCTYFPERTYGECTFPAGWYEALRIRLGEAKGKNWWCVLYPRLCFQDCLHAVVEEEKLKNLKEILTVEEYESLMKKPQKWKLTFRWF